VQHPQLQHRVRPERVDLAQHGMVDLQPAPGMLQRGGVVTHGSRPRAHDPQAVQAGQQGCQLGAQRRLQRGIQRRCGRQFEHRHRPARPGRRLAAPQFDVVAAGRQHELESCVGPFVGVPAGQLLAQASRLDPHDAVLSRVEAGGGAQEDLDAQHHLAQARHFAVQAALHQVAQESQVARRAAEQRAGGQARQFGVDQGPRRGGLGGGGRVAGVAHPTECGCSAP
jgi:hypothetical protein